MAKKKKVEVEVIDDKHEEEVVTPVAKKASTKKVTKKVDDKILESKEINITPLKEAGLFSVKAIGDVKLRKLPSMKDTADNIQGKMLKNKIYKVMATIDYTPMKMYKLENGFYIIADQNIKVI